MELMTLARLLENDLDDSGFVNAVYAFLPQVSATQVMFSFQGSPR